MASVYSISSTCQSDEALQNKLLNDSYGGGTQGWLKEQVSGFFRDITNMRYVRAVMDFYSRDLPAQDTHNHWDDQYKFYRACTYFKQFGMPIDNTNASNCALFKGLQTAIQQAMEDADKLNASGAEAGVIYTYKTQVLADLNGFVNTAFATLQCDFVLTQQQQDMQLSALADATTAATNNTSAASGGLTTYIVYGIIAVIVIVVLVKIFKH